MYNSKLSIKNSKLNKFTMIELLVVIGIIGIMASMLIGTFSGGVDKAQEAEAKAIMAKVVAAAISDVAVTGEVTSPFGLSSDELGDKDPWGRSFDATWKATYETNFEQWRVTVTTPDGKEIYSWK